LAATSGPFRNVVEPRFDDVITPESFCQEGIGMESGEMPPPLSAQAVSDFQGPAALEVVKSVPPTDTIFASSAG